MAIISSKYNPPLWFRQTDIMTIYAAKLRNIAGVNYSRKRLELPDGDFLDLDWSDTRAKTQNCIILLHGLEGSSQSNYMLGMTKYYNQHGYDICAMNFRSCGGDMNRLYTCYHSGKTEDLKEVIQHVQELNKYKNILLFGVSLGANLLLKYLGEGNQLPKELKAAIAVSAPCDLSGSSTCLSQKRNYLYAQNFYKQLIHKLKLKQSLYPDKISDGDIKKIKTIRDFDEFYTSKAHGFANAEDYYKKCSSLQFLKNISTPTLLLSAKNDSFISIESYPYAIAKEHSNVYLETPDYGGHVAFWQKGGIYYHEQRSLEFANEMI